MTTVFTITTPDSENSSIQAAPLGNTVYTSYTDLPQSAIGFFRGSVGDIVDMPIEEIASGYDSENVVSISSVSKKKKDKESLWPSNGSGEVVVIDGDNLTPEDVSHTMSMRQIIKSEPGKKILNLLLARISLKVSVGGIEGDLNSGDMIYPSLKNHLVTFGDIGVQINSNDYKTLFAYIEYLRTIDSKEVFFQEGDDTLKQVKKIMFDNKWSKNFNPIDEFCSAFVYILKSNQANNVTASNQIIS